jgi:hypothetical protein
VPGPATRGALWLRRARSNHKRAGSGKSTGRRRGVVWWPRGERSAAAPASVGAGPPRWRRAPAPAGWRHRARRSTNNRAVNRLEGVKRAVPLHDTSGGGCGQPVERWGRHGPGDCSPVSAFLVRGESGRGAGAPRGGALPPPQTRAKRAHLPKGECAWRGGRTGAVRAARPPQRARTTWRQRSTQNPFLYGPGPGKDQAGPCLRGTDVILLSLFYNGPPGP